MSPADGSFARKPIWGGVNSDIGIDFAASNSQPDVVGSALDLPFEDCSFNAVVSAEVQEHGPDPLRALGEMHHLTKTFSPKMFQ
jgi:SAM-dependent methyltransferase